jgi:sec-independent protein translocase protein TatA
MPVRRLVDGADPQLYGLDHRDPGGRQLSMPPNGFSIWHLLVVLAIVLVLFGRRRGISSIIGDFEQGIDAFKKGLADQQPHSGASPPRRGLSPGLLLMAIVALIIIIAAFVKILQQN